MRVLNICVHSCMSTFLGFFHRIVVCFESLCVHACMFRFFFSQDSYVNFEYVCVYACMSSFSFREQLCVLSMCVCTHVCPISRIWVGCQCGVCKCGCVNKKIKCLPVQEQSCSLGPLHASDNGFWRKRLLFCTSSKKCVLLAAGVKVLAHARQFSSALVSSKLCIIKHGSNLNQNDV